MKKIIVFLLTVFFVAECLSQAPAPSKEYYLQKSKSQKTAGWVLLGGGTTMAVVGVILASNDNPEEPYDIYGSNFETGSVLMLTGLAADLISIPFFISSANNARRAASVGLTNQRVLIAGQNGLLTKTQPAITFRIKL